MRLVLVTRQFWPQNGEAETALVNLGNFLHQADCEIHVLTARWEPHWPIHFTFRNFEVTRLAHPSTKGWGQIWYMRRLARWLVSHREEYDAVLVSSGRHDAFSAITSRKQHGRPVLVRFEESGPDGDCRWHAKAPFGEKIRNTVFQADHLIASGEAVYQEMVRHGYPTESTTVVPNGVPVMKKRDPELRSEVRAALSEVHRVLRLSENSPLVLYAGPMRESNRVLDLVSAWPKVLEHHPTAKLWLVGQGEQAAEIWTLVRDLGMRDSVIMVGTFDDLSPVLQATDVFVVPEGRGQPSTFTLTAMGAGVPVVAGEGASSASVTSRQTNMFTFSEGHVDGLAEALLFVLQSGPVVQDRIRRGIQEVERRNSIELMGQRHIHLLKKCLSR